MYVNHLTENTLVLCLIVTFIKTILRKKNLFIYTEDRMVLEVLSRSTDMRSLVHESHVVKLSKTIITIQTSHDNNTNIERKKKIISL